MSSGVDVTKGLISSEQVRLNGAQAEGNRIQKSINMDLEAENRKLRNQAREKDEELRKVKVERDKYKNLLCKPMAEIAQEDDNFRETYEAQMELMADWMVSQKAFKELAIEFGFEKGLTVEETIQKGFDKELDVLDSKHEEKHNTNANDSSIIEPRIEKLKAKILASEKK